jgi:hypothetical protein
MPAYVPFVPFLTAGILALVPMSAAQNDTRAVRVDWRDNMLTISSPRLPGGKVEINYLEAFCRRGSTSRKWEQTVIPHKTVRTDGEGPKSRLQLKSTVEGGVEVQHDIRVVDDGVRFDLRVTNTGSAPVDIEWAQPCMRVAEFTGRTQETYVDRCFLFTDRRERNGLTLLTELPRAEEAIYHGGQVYVPRGVDKADVNPRPISTVIPANDLIGCFSADGKSLLAMAWNSTQELFQGVVTCVHSDFRIGGLKPGETKRLIGKVYLMDNDTTALLKHYRRDFPSRKR